MYNYERNRQVDNEKKNVHDKKRTREKSFMK